MFEILIRSYEIDFMVIISARICIFLVHLRFQDFSAPASLVWSAAAVLNIAHSSKVKHLRDKFGFSTSFSESAT